MYSKVCILLTQKFHYARAIKLHLGIYRRQIFLKALLTIATNVSSSILYLNADLYEALLNVKHVKKLYDTVEKRSVILKFDENNRVRANFCTHLGYRSPILEWVAHIPTFSSTSPTEICNATTFAINISKLLTVGVKQKYEGSKFEFNPPSNVQTIAGCNFSSKLKQNWQHRLDHGNCANENRIFHFNHIDPKIHFMRLEFYNMAEARTRALLLLMLSWNAIGGVGAKLLTDLEVRHIHERFEDASINNTTISFKSLIWSVTHAKYTIPIQSLSHFSSQFSASFRCLKQLDDTSTCGEVSSIKRKEAQRVRTESERLNRKRMDNKERSMANIQMKKEFDKPTRPKSIFNASQRNNFQQSRVENAQVVQCRRLAEELVMQRSVNAKRQEQVRRAEFLQSAKSKSTNLLIAQRKLDKRNHFVASTLGEMRQSARITQYYRLAQNRKLKHSRNKQKKIDGILFSQLKNTIARQTAQPKAKNVPVYRNTNSDQTI